MDLLDYIAFVYRGLDSAWTHFVGLYAVFDFDIVGFLIICFSAMAVLRVLTNGSLSLSKTIDVPTPIDSGRTRKLESDHNESLKEDSSET